MKRIVTAALAAATLAVPLTPVQATAQDYHRGYYRDDDEDRDRGDDRRDWRRNRDDDHGEWRRDRDDERGYRQRRWDQRRYNGYSYRGAWYYGPPPVAYYDDPYFNPGYRAWRRGDRLPSYYRSHYREVDWRDCGLRRPPRGYRYVEDDRGEYLLVGIATGIILGAILSNGY